MKHKTEKKEKAKKAMHDTKTCDLQDLFDKKTYKHTAIVLG